MSIRAQDGPLIMNVPALDQSATFIISDMETPQFTANVEDADLVEWTEN